MEDANYVESMEHKMMEQQRVIEALQAQNQLLSLQLRQHQDYLAVVQSQNNALLTAYNALQSVSAANTPSITTTVGPPGIGWNVPIKGGVDGVDTKWTETVHKKGMEAVEGQSDL